MAFALTQTLFSLLLLLPISVVAQTISTITVGASLTASDNSSWLSPSGDFAFGFRQLNNDLFWLSIWYARIPDKTIVCPQGQVLWSPQMLTGGIVTFGVMNNTGNFILKDSNFNYIWESFKNPTDTILPTQFMEREGVLSSRQSETNFSKGRFQLRLLPNGNLVLNSINLPTNYANEAYYTSGTSDSNTSSPVKQLQISIIEPLSTLMEFSPYILTQRRPMEMEAGILSGLNQITFARIFLFHQALVFVGLIVSAPSRQDSRPTCKCPTGYSLLDPNDEYGCCKPNFIQGCEEDELSSTKDLYSAEKLINTDWPTSDYIKLKPFKEVDCRNSCLQDYATNGFKEELGKGAFGIVYKGTIKMGSNIPVAVKKLNRFAQESDKEFKAEVNVIGRTHHKNLIFLFGDLKPHWKQRIQIAFGIARGLLYLHEECSTQIIHCDIKPHNILLDEYYNARISDFGLAKLLMMDQSHTLTNIRGTRGYVAPEWFRNMPVTVKVDVYSFGVMLLEIICCRKSVDVESGREETAILTDWAYDCFRERTLDALVEHDMEALGDIEKLERFVMVAIWCIQEDPSLRPTMGKVMQMLEGVVHVHVPPCPSPFTTNNEFIKVYSHFALCI
uniref:Protein kinase domain-containing protein n=1 Tax=Fagus sylvatica TaxID=28930 RepID=A0A2N9J8Q1_FAGSY